MDSLAEAAWSDIEILRARVSQFSAAPRLVAAANSFCELFTASFASVVLARMFVVLPLAVLPEEERSFATRLSKRPEHLTAQTRILCLLGTNGRSASWNDRLSSTGHLAIPLLDSASVAATPMIAKLLSDLDVDLRVLDDGRPIATRQMLGGKNGIFYVADAGVTIDSQGRRIVPAEDFVRANHIQTVFGMGGAYLDGTLAVCVLFCNEKLDRLIVDRFASFIASFKMATSELVQEGRIF